MGGASLPVGTAWCHNGVRYPLPRLVGRTRPPILFSASDSRYSHYPLHERRYPYRQSAHLCVLSCVTACCSHQAGLAGNNVRSALRFVQRLLFVLRHADHEIRAGYAETGISLAAIPFGLYQSICFVPFRHTATIITAAVPLALWFRNRPFSLFLSAVIALMGFSRVWLGQHHPIDIVGGMLLGSIAARCIACERLPMGKEEQQALGEQKIREETGK